MKLVEKCFFVKYRTFKIIFICVLIVTLVHLYYEHIHVDEEDIVDTIHKKNLKAVQLLTGRFSSNDWQSMYARLGEFPFQGCQEKRCFAFKPYYFRQKAIEASDAVIVHVPNLFFMTSRASYKRHPHQLWVFMTQESQRRTFCSSHYRIEDMDNWFNLTATFKLDSVVPNDYKPFRDFTKIKSDPRFLKHFIMLVKEPPTAEYFQKRIGMKEACKKECITQHVKVLETHDLFSQYKTISA